ncbi:MAG: hypothetical protein ACO1NU_09605 [Arcticibacter sp.]
MKTLRTTFKGIAIVVAVLLSTAVTTLVYKFFSSLTNVEGNWAQDLLGFGMWLFAVIYMGNMTATLVNRAFKKYEG